MNNPAVTEPASLRLDQSTADGHSNGESPNLKATGTQNAILISKNDQGWRRIVRNFSPSWFSVTMGTGVVATFLITIPWQAAWLYYLSIIFFILNVILWSAALITSILRYTIWPEIWSVMIQDSTNSLFLATMPIGLATLIEMWIFVCVPAWGEWAAYLAWSWWMLDSILAVSVTVTMAFLL